MEGNAVSQVSCPTQNSKPLTWPEEADIICLFATVEGYNAHRGWLGEALLEEIKEWLDNWERTRDTQRVYDIEFYHLLIRVNANIGMFHVEVLSMNENMYWGRIQ